MADNWVGTWMAAPQLTEPANLPPAPGFSDTTLRQVIRVTLGGKQIRVRFSNEFGMMPLTLTSVHIAKPAAGGAIRTETDRGLTFERGASVTIPPGGIAISDTISYDLPPLSDLAVTLHTQTSSHDITGHPGSRCTSYLCAGDHVSEPDLTSASKIDHWYFLSGVEVQARRGSGAVVTLGDSITDGRGSPTNGNGRWPDFLAQRLQRERATSDRVAVLNAGIGGNCVIRGGLGPPALARLDRDVLTRPGARWLIVFEGINDLGTRSSSASDMIAAYKQIIVLARARGLRIYGATILPCGKSFYFTPELEAARQEINEWIRNGNGFDAVIDLDAVLRDPAIPSQLAAIAESPDHLHPSGLAYKILAESIDLRLFTH